MSAREQHVASHGMVQDQRLINALLVRFTSVVDDDDAHGGHAQVPDHLVTDGLVRRPGGVGLQLNCWQDWYWETKTLSPGFPMSMLMTIF